MRGHSKGGSVEFLKKMIAGYLESPVNRINTV